jgi:hypothetical protein
MNHFPPGDWIDLARGVLEPAQAARLESHLRQECEECRKSSELWRQLLRCADREAGYEPPESAVSAAKTAYVSAEPARWLPRLAHFARLVFDSFSHPELAMVRASAESSRRLLHELEPFAIDLRLESDPVRKHTSLMGQVLNSRHPDELTTGIDVVLLSGEKVVKRTTANAEGEFELDFGPENDLQLFINIRGHRAIGIILPEPQI